MDGVTFVEMDTEKYYYSWDDFDNDIDLIANTYTQKRLFNPKLIIGIARGGLIPAVALSHKLGIPFQSTTWQDRDGGVKEKIFIPDDTLVVDDINDTGLTFEAVCSGFNTRYDTVSLWQRKDSKFNVDLYARSCDNEWIVFPWENDKE